MSLDVRIAASSRDYAVAAHLMRNYVAWLGLDLSFQSFEDEINDLAIKYSPPRGGLFLARIDDLGDVGCCGYAPLPISGACEAKRLFVIPEARGLGVARTLMRKVLVGAEGAGYQEMFLDTLPTMTHAIRLYEGLGFKQTDPYYKNPLVEALFFRSSLCRTDV